MGKTQLLKYKHRIKCKISSQPSNRIKKLNHKLQKFGKKVQSNECFTDTAACWIGALAHVYV